MGETLRVRLDQLETSEEDIYREAVYQGRPFTGVAWDDDGQETCEIPYVDGEAHGRCVWRYKNGRPSLDDLVDHGTVVESTSWYPPGDVVHCRFAGGVRRYYYKDGTLGLERGGDYERGYYPSGALRDERYRDGDGGTRSAWYGEDGVWAVRGRQEPKKLGQRLPPEPEYEYNDEYLRAAYLKLLETPDFTHYFLDWLFQRTEAKPGGRFRRWAQDNRPKTLSNQGRAMVCAMIEYDDLRVKYRGVTMAGQYRVNEARPLLEKALLVRETPPPCYSLTGGGSSYGWTVSQAAQKALSLLGGGK